MPFLLQFISIYIQSSRVILIVQNNFSCGQIAERIEMVRYRFLSVSLALLLLTGCGSSAASSVSDTAQDSDSDTAGTGTSALSTGTVQTDLSQIDMSKWQYDSDNDVYYQVGISYCETPADTSYETMGIYVPGKFMTAKDNGDGTWTCSVNTAEKVGNYTASTAPVIVPVNTPGYAAQAAPTGYDSSTSEFTTAGMVVVVAGCRGRDAGAPSGVTDLKAAIRYTRYNEGVIPGNMDSIFSEGMSGGGAQSALLGSTGDSALYDAYLKQIGAVTGVSDAVAGSMCWCPITNLDVADEAYEWNMGVTRTGLTDEEQTLSDGMATAFAEYINKLGLKDESGNTLTLEKSDEGIYQAGSYYDYLMETVETSLDNFLADNTFPYTVESGGGMMGGGAPGGKGQKPDGNLPAMDGNAADAASGTSGQMPAMTGAAPGAAAGSSTDSSAAGTSATDYTQIDQISRSSSSTAAVTLSGTYDTVQDYIDALNEPYTWVKYDASTNKVTITSMSDFVRAMKVASKGIAAFDELDAGQGENTLFGYGDGQGAHFDSILAGLLTGTDYEDAFTTDLAKKDSAGNTVQTRVDMYNPMYYLSDYYDGYQTSNVAKYWRIRTGIDQGDTALSTEVDLALAAENYSSDTKVDFATVWGLGHTMAERTGDSTSNFIDWVNTCLAE
jgi:hypothetical protein